MNVVSRVIFIVCVFCLFSLSVTVGAADGRLPGDELNLKLDAPIKTWDEAIPLGNGMLGGLIWGEGNTIRVSLDRGDLWDERTPDRIHDADYTWAEIQAAVKRGDQRELLQRFDSFYNQIKYPTKLPGGRLELTLDPSLKVESFELDLSSATGLAHFEGGETLRGFYSAEKPVALFRIPGKTPVGLRFLAPSAVKQLGYPDAVQGKAGSEQWFVQEGVLGLKYAAVAATRRVGGETLLALTIHAVRDGSDPLPEARKIVKVALAEGYDALVKPHEAWWRGFWEKSSVFVPDAHHLRHYYLVQYYYGAASRKGAPPMPLQGVWTADGGSLPPWKGDYHHDLNTQMTYAAYQTAGRFEEGACFLDYMYDLLPEFRKFARKFYEAPGAAVPSVMTQDGQMMGGWIMYSLSPTNGAWVGYLFYQHWLYTQDGADLKRGYEWNAELGECLLHLLKPDADGVLKLPLSSSPEIYNNSLSAWLKPNSNYDLDCMLALFRGLEHMGKALGKKDEAAKWGRAAEGLGDRLVDPATNQLMFSEGVKFDQAHRHLSQAMSIHPFGLLNIEGSKKDVEVIRASEARFDELGTQPWTGYSFSWMACLRARTGDARAALEYLDVYEKAFILRNGFHVNGDQLKAGYSGFTYRPFTLEGNFLHSQAVHEMLLQSWDGVVRLFPASPWRWHEARFEDLRAEGGFKISARREINATVWFKIQATKDGVLRLRDNFGGRELKWKGRVARKRGENYVVRMKAGDVVEASLVAPTSLQEEPAEFKTKVRERKLIQANKLPLRIGANTMGSNRFLGDIARASVFSRPLSGGEVLAIAKGGNSDSLGEIEGCVASWDFSSGGDGGFVSSGSSKILARAEGKVGLVDAEGLGGKAVRLNGEGFLTTAHVPALDCLGGFTLEAWVRPKAQGSGGARIIDKSPVGGASAYLLDTYPGNSLRLIFRDPHVSFPANLPVDKWTHVAATVEGKTGKAALYVNGEKVVGE